MFVDHWEPTTGTAAINTTRYWTEDYARMASRHRDADGRMPQHTWFCKDLDPEPLRMLARSVFDGLGEMEVHIHHGTPNDDRADNTAAMSGEINRFVATLQRFGACTAAEPKPRTFFGFVHGHWALDDSRFYEGHMQYCGVRQELVLLASRGCYADFTFPAWGTMEPAIKNAIFASKDSPQRKSYGDPSLIRVLRSGGERPSSGELLIFEGPYCRTSTNIDADEAPSLNRMNQWVAANVRIPGREDWVFVKVYTHSAQNLDAAAGYSNILGEAMDNFYGDLEKAYNDGAKWKLHYATTREAYSIAMAAVDGKSGDPNAYRDYVIPRPANRLLYCDAPYRLISYDPALGGGEARLEILDKPKAVEIVLQGATNTLAVFESNDSAEARGASDATLRKLSPGTVGISDKSPSRFYRLTRKAN